MITTSRVSSISVDIVLEHPFHYIPYSTDQPQQTMQIDGFYILHFLHRWKDYAAGPRPLEIRIPGIEERKTENLDLCFTTSMSDVP